MKVSEARVRQALENKVVPGAICKSSVDGILFTVPHSDEWQLIVGGSIVAPTERALEYLRTQNGDWVHVVSAFIPPEVEQGGMVALEERVGKLEGRLKGSSLSLREAVLEIGWAKARINELEQGNAILDKEHVQYMRRTEKLEKVVSDHMAEHKEADNTIIRSHPPKERERKS